MNQHESLFYIRSLLTSATDVERRIGEFIVSSPEDFINITVKEMSRAISVSEGSIVRFCKKLGYEGFTALKIAVAMSIQAQDRFVLGDVVIGGANDVYSVMTQVFESVFAVLREALCHVGQAELLEAAKQITGANRIEFYGLGTSAPIVQDAYYRFMRIGLNANACVDPHIMCVSAGLMKPGSLAIAVSHTGRSKQTVMALEEAKKNGANTMCITSYAGSPITKYADIRLVTSSGGRHPKEATIARIAHIAVLDSLCTYIAMQNSNMTVKAQNQLLEILEEQRY